ncbi:MAG: hypothetical protein RR376_04340 [Janthinobacterium sp.]|jgi:hypothetical protein
MKEHGSPGGARVVVIGGTGESGRRILRVLRARHPQLQLCCAARRPRPHELPAGVASATLDMRDSEAALALLCQFDLAIIALGPMDAFGAAPHALCLQAGIDCIDINDSLASAEAILALDGEARRAGRTILTGMGLAPGLSGLLLMKLAREQASPAGVYRSRFYAGAAYGGGETSPYAILDSFKPDIEVLRQGKRRHEAAPWHDGHASFLFPGQAKAAPLIAYSAPEVAALAAPRGRSGVAAQVMTFDPRYHIQFLTPGAARFFGRIGRWKGMRQRLARMFFNSGQSVKKRKNADADCSLWVYPDDRPEDGWLLHGAMSSYDFTALMACAATDTLLAGALGTDAGAYSVEHLAPDGHDALEAALRRYGVTCRRAGALRHKEDPLHFGWCQPVDGGAASLAHYGACWYDIVVHPRMTALQTRYLTDSAIWGLLRSQVRGLAFAGFVCRVMLRWRAHYAALAPLRAAHADHAAQWARITRDISMFTSGYSRARELLGQNEAFALYRRMFLETGRMEMRWLWPVPEVIAETAEPALAVRDYWLAFVGRCEELGLLRGRRSEHGYAIEYCAYAEMFFLLGCPELANVVREMEHEALGYMAAQAGVEVCWRAGANGSASVSIEALEASGAVRGAA